MGCDIVRSLAVVAVLIDALELGRDGVEVRRDAIGERVVEVE